MQGLHVDLVDCAMELLRARVPGSLHDVSVLAIGSNNDGTVPHCNYWNTLDPKAKE